MHVPIVVNIAPSWSSVVPFLDNFELSRSFTAKINFFSSFLADTLSEFLAVDPLSCNFRFPFVNKGFTCSKLLVSLVNTVVKHAVLSQAVSLLYRDGTIICRPYIAAIIFISVVSVFGCFLTTFFNFDLVAVVIKFLSLFDANLSFTSISQSSGIDSVITNFCTGIVSPSLGKGTSHGLRSLFWLEFSTSLSRDCNSGENE